MRHTTVGVRAHAATVAVTNLAFEQEKGPITMMTKKDFIALADAIRAHNKVCNDPNYGHSTPFDSTHLCTLERFLRTRNPNFMPARWIGYIKGECGPNGGCLRKPGEDT